MTFDVCDERHHFYSSSFFLSLFPPSPAPTLSPRQLARISRSLDSSLAGIRSRGGEGIQIAAACSNRDKVRSRARARALARVHAGAFTQTTTRGVPDTGTNMVRSSGHTSGIEKHGEAARKPRICRACIRIGD